jgi:Caspase domain
MNALLCIGCDTYDSLPILSGAEKDAKAVFALLAPKKEENEQTVSNLLLSPSLLSVQQALNATFAPGQDIDAFTFFFAGHGAVKAGSFYLCVRDSAPDRLSTSAFPMISLFSVINELRPRQVNLIVDACQAGASSFDLSQLLKSEVIGSSEASSISFLGACSSDQSAGEEPEGGILTRELTKCLKGEREVQTKTPFLDLIEVGVVVCQEVLARHPEQKPITWGLSLFGRGSLARNPHFDTQQVERSFPVGSIVPSSKTGGSVRAHSSALWSEYRAIGENPCPRRLLDLVDKVLRDGGGEISDIIHFLQGISRTLSVRARESTELLASSQCLATVAVSLLPRIDVEEAKCYARQVLREIVSQDGAVWTQELARVKADSLAFLSDASPMSDLYYLPMRLVKTLGWIGLSTVTRALLPGLCDSDDSTEWKLALEILDRYEASIVSVSDEQAPSLYVFLKACLVKNQRELAVRAANLCYGSFADRKGNVTRVGTDGAQALRYVLSTGPEAYRPEEWRPANPSQLLAVLLLAGARLGIGNTWDLRALDRRSSGFFIPSNYRDFGREVIENGMNYTHHVGFGVWTPADFAREFDRAIQQSLPSETAEFPKEGAALCTAASLFFPNRLPLLLERML